MDDLTTIDDNMSVRSESVGGRSPPSLSPVVSVSNSGSPTSPPPPLLSGPQMMSVGALSGHHTPPIFHTSSPSSRPPFLPSLYFPHAYNSPPPIHTSDPTANDCKLVEYRGQKVAAFIINQDTMLCLPQAFELFLKNLVGGLHTVYTKLKRLGIEPLVCNVEQVRVLRGLGAIQPGVNRCKLLCIKHFDVLYKDCTTARRRDRLSSLLHDRFENQVICFSHTHRRPGRPPKRPHEIMGPMQLTGPLPPGAIPNHISPEALMALKKSRMDGRDFPHFMNGGSTPMDNEMEKSPLLSNGYNPPPKALMAQYMALNGGLPHPALFAHSGLPIPPPPGNPWPQHPQQDNPFKVGPPPQDSLTRYMLWENCRVSCDEVIKHLERIRDDRSRNDRMIGLPEREDSLERPRSASPSHSRSRSPSPHKTINGYGDNDVLNLSKAESRDDLSDPGNHGMATSDHSPLHDTHDDKDDILSDNDDFDDKIDLSDREDYDYPSRSLHVGITSETSNNNNMSALNNNSSLLSAVGNITINKNLTESLSSHSNSSNLSNISTMPTSTATGLLTTTEERVPQGLNLSNSLMNLSMSLAAHTNALQHNPLTNGNANPLVVNASSSDRGSGDGLLGSIGSPSTASTPVGAPTPQPPLSSLENLLGNIQNLLKVAAESVRHEEKQWYREKEHFKIEFIRLKEIRDKLEKQLMEDEKLKVLYQRKLKKEKRARRRLEEQLTEKLQRLSQYETNAKDNLLALRNSECFSKESVQSAVAAAAAAAAVANAVSAAASSSNNTITSATLSRGLSNCNLPENGTRLSPKPQKDLEQTQSDPTAMYFNKPLLFNCPV